VLDSTQQVLNVWLALQIATIVQRLLVSAVLRHSFPLETTVFAMKLLKCSSIVLSTNAQAAQHLSPAVLTVVQLLETQLV
jgi:hypothetical protein